MLQPYRIDVQQGNVLEKEAIGQLKYGMSQQQVKYLLGTPIIMATFNPNRWDYVYRLQPGHDKAEQKHLTLLFDQNQLIQASGDFAIEDVQLQQQAAKLTQQTPQPSNKHPL